MSRLTVLGSGAWGTALALTAVRAGHLVTLWGRNTETLRLLAERPEWLPTIQRTTDLTAACRGAECFIFALPAQTFRTFLTSFSPHVPLIVASKGLEIASGLLLSECMESLEGKIPLGFLSGPHLASEVSQGLPTAGTLGVCGTLRETEWLSFLQHPHFKLTLSTDIKGVQIAGAWKNMCAIISGIAMGAGWGENARAALLTKSFAEMQQFGQALGAEPNTFLTQAGIGDFMLTCFSARSRNTCFGQKLARGENPDPASPLAEGAFTTPAVLKRAHLLHLRLPLMETLGHLLEKPEALPLILPQFLETLP